MKNKICFLRKLIALSFLFLPCKNIFSQEILKSFNEDYYDFLSVTGLVEKSFMNYRTMEEGVYNKTENYEEEQDIWIEKNLGKKKQIGNENSPFYYKIFAGEWFSSYNTAYPFGVNDGGLWQGKGYNSALTFGARLEAFGFNLTFRPQFSFSQNQEFEIMSISQSKLNSGYSEYGYFWGNCDAPQRFGDSSLINFDFGDTEIRYTFKNFTVGFGTESIWLGPSVINSLLHSNNASGYPKFDIGLRKTKIILPFLDWYLGDIETRLWVGYLTESDYFDSNDENDHNQISGFNISYAFPFLRNLTFGFTKITLSKWGDDFWLYALPFFNGNTTSGVRVGEDQKASFTFDWKFPSVGFEAYTEIGIDDFLPDGISFYGYSRYPFHTITYTVGLKKTFEHSRQKKLRGILNFEWNNTEGSQDYQMWSGSAYNFGFHGQITQGYTNKGQWLGSGIGYGGNSQYLSYTLYHKYGYAKAFIARNNIDNNYIYYQSVDADSTETIYNGARYFSAFKANFYTGMEVLHFITNDLSIKFNFTYDLVINPTYEPGIYTYTSNGKTYNKWTIPDYLNNFHLEAAVKLQL